MVNVIVFHESLAGGCIAISPVPTGADTGVVEIGDVAMSDGTELCVCQDNSAGAGVKSSPVLDDAAATQLRLELELPEGTAGTNALAPNWQ